LCIFYVILFGGLVFFLARIMIISYKWHLGEPSAEYGRVLPVRTCLSGPGYANEKTCRAYDFTTDNVVA
jgi:hypothetical protein